MCSASSIARLIEATVASMLTTTPLRSPFDGCEPTPMMSMPSSVTSPTMAQIFVVPMSRPTRMSPVFAMSPPPDGSRDARRPLRPSRADRLQPHGDPVRAPAVVQVQHLRAPPVRREGGEHALEPVELVGQVAVAEAHLEAVVARPQRRPEVRVDVDLGDRRAPVEPALRPARQERERGGEERLDLGAPLDPRL